MKDEKIDKLIPLIAQGDKPAFNQVVERYYRKAYLYLRRMTEQASEAEDLVQEAFMILWQKANTFKAGASFEPWFYKILYHLSMDYYRSHKPSQLADEVEIEDTSHSPYDNLHDRDTEARLHQSLSHLSSQERAAMVLFYYHDMNAKDIAAILGSTEQAIQSLLYRSRKTLKRWWQGH